MGKALWTINAIAKTCYACNLLYQIQAHTEPLFKMCNVLQFNYLQDTKLLIFIINCIIIHHLTFLILSPQSQKQM